MFQVKAHQGLIIISDLVEHADCSDFVLPVGPASQHLARLAIRRPVNSVLDMGCGSGIQALLASRHARHVLATDINPRALAFTRLNAALNGIHNIETAEGSFFEPVQSRKFDLILFNPPYILSPRGGGDQPYAFSDQDAYIYELLRMLPEHMTEKSFAQLTFDWTHARDEPWQHPLEDALGRLPVDALILYQGSLTARQYAAFWTNHEIGKKTNGFQRYWKAVNWAAWLRRQRITRIAFGSITLRRRTSLKNWIRAEAATSTFGDSVSHQLVNIFANHDYQEEHMGAGGIFETPVELERSLFQKQGGEKTGELHAVAGVLFPIQMRNITWQVLDALDGKTGTADIVQRILQSNGLAREEFLPGIQEDLDKLFRFGWLHIGSQNKG